jgi:hypothetical protein
MPQIGFIYTTPDWAIGCALLALLWLAAEVGFHLGVRARAQQQAGNSLNIDLVHGAILGLLSLLLAFTYSFVADRHKVRQALIVREANAIGTAFLRSGLLQETPRRELQALLRQYLDSRILTEEVLAEPSKVAEAIQRSVRLQAALWPTASRYIAGRTPTVLDSLVFQALNEIIDVHTERLAAAEYRLPSVILWLLCVLALTGLALTGFASGLRGRRSAYGTGALAVLVMAVILVIIALDSPQEQSFIRVSQTSLIQLRDSLQPETTTTALPQPAPTLQRDTQ